VQLAIKRLELGQVCLAGVQQKLWVLHRIADPRLVEKLVRNHRVFAVEAACHL
jgi:hypothetical protein